MDQLLEGLIGEDEDLPYVNAPHILVEEVLSDEVHFEKKNIEYVSPSLRSLRPSLEQHIPSADQFDWSVSMAHHIWEGEATPYNATFNELYGSDFSPQVVKSDARTIKQSLKAPFFAALNDVVSSLKTGFSCLVIGAGNNQDLYRLSKACGDNKRFTCDTWDPFNVPYFRSNRFVNDKSIPGKDVRGQVRLPQFSKEYDLILFPFSFHYFIRGMNNEDRLVLRSMMTERTHLLGVYPSMSGILTNYSMMENGVPVMSGATQVLSVDTNARSGPEMTTKICGRVFTEPVISSSEMFIKLGFCPAVVHSRNVSGLFKVSNKLFKEAQCPENRGFNLLYHGPRYKPLGPMLISQSQADSREKVFSLDLLKTCQSTPPFPIDGIPINAGRLVTSEDLHYFSKGGPWWYAPKTDGETVSFFVKSAVMYLSIRSIWKFCQVPGSPDCSGQMEYERENKRMTMIELFYYEGVKITSWYHGMTLQDSFLTRCVLPITRKQWKCFAGEDLLEVAHGPDFGEGFVFQNEFAPIPRFRKGTWKGYARYYKHHPTVDIMLDSDMQYASLRYDTSDAPEDPRKLFTGPGVYEFLVRGTCILRRRHDKQTQNTQDQILNAVSQLKLTEIQYAIKVNPTSGKFDPIDVGKPLLDRFLRGERAMTDCFLLGATFPHTVKGVDKFDPNKQKEFYTERLSWYYDILMSPEAPVVSIPYYDDFLISLRHYIRSGGRLANIDQNLFM
jgi:hypothetical protein